MPDFCCAVGSSNTRSNKRGLSFYNIPRKNTPFERNRRELWLKAIRREDWTDDAQIKNARLCSAHFISGKRSDDTQNPDFVPSIFTFARKTSTQSAQKVKRFERFQKRRHLSFDLTLKSDQSDIPTGIREDQDEVDSEGMNDEVNSEAINDSDIEGVTSLNASIGVQCEPDPIYTEYAEISKNYAMLQDEMTRMSAEMYTLREENEKLKRTISKRTFSLKNIKNSDSLITFFTGIPTLSLFMWIVQLLSGKVNCIRNTLSFEDHLLIVLMKIRLGLMNKDLAFRFGVTSSVVSKIYRTWLPEISKCLAPLIIWPSKSAVRKNMPVPFQKKFKNCRVIIDCSEIFIQRPTNLTARAQTWSNYKHNNTIKYLIGITPAGAVSYLSSGWGGRVSDKQITLESGFLDKLVPGDCVLADRGFQIQEELAANGAVLLIPSFTKGKSQLSAKDVDLSRQLAHVRIHVERIIGKLKTFRLLQTIIPISQVELLDDVMIVCSAIVNLNKSIVRK